MKEAERYLLQKFLDGRCTAEELRRVGLLMKTQQGLDALDELMQAREASQWDNPQEADAGMQEETRVRLIEMQQRIAAHDRNFFDKAAPVARMRQYLKYAAVLAGVLLTAGGITMWQLKKNAGASDTVALIEKTNGANAPAKYVLPDSSVVYLGAGSRITYADNFKGKIREIRLSGEALFDVKHNASKDFIVHAGGLDTKDIGTSFKIEAFAGQPVVVSVATGKVSVRESKADGGSALGQLTPGLKVTWDSLSGKVEQGTIDIAGIEQWKAGELVFDEQPLSIVFKEIENRYNRKITITDAVLGSYRVSAAFAADAPIEEVMKILSRSGRFTYVLTGNGYQVSEHP